jgi:hypothetical protein
MSLCAEEVVRESRKFGSSQAQCENAYGRSPLKINLAVLALFVLAASSTSAQQPTHRDPLLDRLAGNWILQGTIAGRKTTHDIESEWVLNREYLRLHETSREKNAQGQPAYEAIILIEWDESSSEYKCLWLDSTGGGGLAVPAADGKRGDDQIVFLFKDKDGNVHTTFAYSKADDSWSWLIDNENGGKLTSFARVKLTRK